MATRISHLIGLVCFVSLALLPWVYLRYGWSWPLLWAALFWLALGTLAVIDPGEWRKQ